MVFAPTQTSYPPRSLWGELLLITLAVVAADNYFVDCSPTQSQKSGLLLPPVQLLSAVLVNQSKSPGTTSFTRLGISRGVVHEPTESEHRRAQTIYRGLSRR